MTANRTLTSFYDICTFLKKSQQQTSEFLCIYMILLQQADQTMKAVICVD